MRGGVAGGVEQLVVGLARGFSRLRRVGERYFFLAYAGHDEWLRPHLGGSCDVVHIPYPARSRRAKGLIRSRLPALVGAFHRVSPLLGSRSIRVARSDGTIERAGADVMHFTTQWAFETNVPSIYHPHDLQHRHLPQYFTPRVRLARDVVFRRFCEQAKVVAIAWPWGKHDLTQQLSVDEEKVRVIPLAPVFDRALPQDEGELAAIARRLELPRDFALYPAQTWPHKNHVGLLRSLAYLRDQKGIEVPLVCAGRQNEHYREIAHEVTALRLERQVRFVGFVSAAELHGLYQRCRCVVIPTKFEAGSFPLWEAFSAGRAAACSNVTSLPEQAGDAALIFNPDDPRDTAEKIERLWIDPALREELAARGRARIEQYSWSRTARIFRAYYRKISTAPLTREDRLFLEQTSTP